MTPGHSRSVQSTLFCCLLLTLTGCQEGEAPPAAGNSVEAALPASVVETRPQDARTWTFQEPDATTFDALAVAEGDSIDVTATSRWAGILEGAAYRIEVPPDWNGRLVLYAHGYRGRTTVLRVTNPPIRRHLLQGGYAWAASSYSRNNYDVRAGIEDTNTLALAFTRLAAEHGRPLATPTHLVLMGTSMGGNIATAAIERETLASVQHRVVYDAALPLCGAVAPRELLNLFGGMATTARELAGYRGYAEQPWSAVGEQVLAALFSSYPDEENPRAPMIPTPLGERWLSVVRQLGGGERPLFDFAVRNGGSLAGPIRSFDEMDDGLSDLNGVLTRSVIDTTQLVYEIAGDAEASARLNAGVERLMADPDANPPRPDGLRWIPLPNGEFDVPVLSLHTIGDLFVPVNLETVYAQRAHDHGNADRLVQRVVRGVAHCDFTQAEIAAAFDALVRWQQDGVKPAGDDVLTPGVMTDEFYGCAFTDNTTGPDDEPNVRAMRTRLQEVAACPVQPEFRVVR